MKRSLLLSLAAIPLIGGLASCNTSSSHYGQDISDDLTYSNEFAMFANKMGSFSLLPCTEGYEFVDSIPQSAYSSFTFGAAFEGFEVYYVQQLDDGSLFFFTVGELASGFNYGTFAGKDITKGGGSFEIRIPVVAAELAAQGEFFSSSSENEVTLTITNGSFHYDIDADDIVLGGAFSNSTISKITPILDPDSGEELPEEEVDPTYRDTYKSVKLTITGDKGPEQYAYITVKDSGTTYNEDLQTSIDLLHKGGILLEGLDTFSLHSYAYFAFSNLTINNDITASDISVSGALEGTIINSVSIVKNADYGDVLAVELTYPETFVGGLDDSLSNAASFLFSSNSNLEGEEFQIDISTPRPRLSTSASYDASSRKVVNTITFENGLFNEDLAVSDFAYYPYLESSSSETVEPLAIADASLSLSDSTLTFSCTMPASFSGGLCYLKVKDIFPIHYADSEKVDYHQYEILQYLD